MEAHVNRLEYSIEQHRCVSAGESKVNARVERERPQSPGLERAVAEAKAVLADGEWHPAREITAIAEAHGVDRRYMLDNIGAAISEEPVPRWVCIPQDHTPELAPSERE